MTDLERCRAEQRAAAQHIIEHGDTPQFRMWLSDYFAEELLILEETREHAKDAGQALGLHS